MKPVPVQAMEFARGDGEMARRIRVHDWSGTALGAVTTWSRSLKTAIGIMLASPSAMWMAWGRGLVFLCNDACLPLVSKGGDGVLGISADAVWESSRAEIGSLLRRVMATGEAEVEEGVQLYIDRNGACEETYHRFSFSAVPDDDGATGGMLCVVTEETEDVVRERRLVLLREIGTEMAWVRDEGSIAGVLSRRLATSPEDVPMALVYLFEARGELARLVCAHGLRVGEAGAPETIFLQDDRSVWPLDRARGSVEMVVVDGLGGRLAELGGVVAKGSPREAALVPIAWPGHSHASGVLIAGVNPFRPFDAEYRGFLSLLAGQISTGLSSVRASDEERRREKALMASIVENSDDAIVSKTLDGVITSWNAGAQRLFGYSAEEAVGQSVLMLIPPERHGEEATILDRMRRGERIENFETVRIGKDGRLLDVSITVSPMRDQSGRLSGASKVARDIGGRKRAEEALRQSEARLRTILSLLPTGVCACDERGRITFFNQRATELCGRAPMAGSRNFDFPGIRTSDGRLCSPEQSPMAEAVRSGRSCRDVEVFMERADGTRFPALVNVAPIFDDTGRIRGAIIVFQDISLQVETRELLRRQQQILEEAVARRTAELQESHQRLRLSERMASLGTLSAGLGHDMANLLIPVRVSLDALGSAPLSDELRADVERISTSARYLQQLATGLRMMALDPSKGAMAERLHLSSWWSDAGAIVKNSLPRGVSVRVDIPDDVWVRMSRPALTQVVFNLVQNAGDALKERSDPVIRIVARRAEDRVVVSVEDNGAGMSEEVQRRCMEPFFTTKTRGISTGLGLVLVGGLVRDAGGTVSIASEAGHGTRFDLDLPSGGDSVRGSDWKRSLIRARVKIGDARLRAFAVDQLGVLQVDVVDGEGGTCDLAVVEGAAESPDGYEGARRVIVLGGDKVASGSVTVLSSRPRPSEFRSALHGAVRELSVDGAGS